MADLARNAPDSFGSHGDHDEVKGHGERAESSHEENKSGIRLFDLLGFEVRLDVSWIFLAVLVTWTLARGYFPSAAEGLSSTAYWAMAVVGALGLFSSIIFHELCHSLVGRRFGMPIHGIKLFVFGGIAEMRDEPPNAKSEFLMAGAGPASSLLLGALFSVVWGFSLRSDWPLPVSAVIGYLAFINVILALFNLLPGFPMDGGRMLRSALWGWKKDIRWATRVASGIGAAFGIGLMIFGVLSFLQGGIIAGLWYFLIGMFLQSISRNSYQQVLVREAFKGETVSRFANRSVVTVEAGLRVDALVQNYFYRYYHSFYPVVISGRLVGCIGAEQVRNIPRKEWTQTLVSDVMVPCGPRNTIESHEGVMEALRRMRAFGRERLLVTNDGKLTGVLSLRDLLGLVSVQLSLRDRTPAATPPENQNRAA